MRFPWVWMLAGLACHSTGGVAPAQEASTWDILVVAPHSDDEAIGCTGVMLRAVAAGQRVGVVVVTAGDAHQRAAAAAAGKPLDALAPSDLVNLAALRQRHSLQAMRRIGVRQDDILFLGYPDGGLASMYDNAGDAPYRQPYTGRTETYGPVAADYHSRVHGRPAPYLRAALHADLAEIIRARRPRAIYVTGEADRHADHRTTRLFVRDAAQAAGFCGELWTYIVHGPLPNTPADLQLTLTQTELDTKRSLLESYQAGVSPVHDRLAETYAQPQERFWREALPRDTK